MTRRVADAAWFMQVLSLPDARDWFALPHDARDYRIRSVSTKLPKDTRVWLKGIAREMDAVPETYKVFAPER